jgi:hypothetical protein
MGKGSLVAAVFAALVLLPATALAHKPGHGFPHRHYPQVTVHKPGHHFRAHPGRHWRQPATTRRVHRHRAPRHQAPVVIIIRPGAVYHLHDHRHDHRW